MTLSSTVTKCKECGEYFEFTSEERKVFVEKGYRFQPQKCLDCRLVTRARKEGKPIYPFNCTKCGKLAHIDFKPIPGRSLYCMACFRSKKMEESGSLVNESG